MSLSIAHSSIGFILQYRMNSLDRFDYVAQIINIVVAVGFLAAFVVLVIKLNKLAESARFVHLYPFKRALFGLIYCLINVTQYILFFDHRKSLDAVSQIQLFYIIGTSINALILIAEIYVMRVQIRKEKPYSPIHRFYWIYLPVITLIRFIEETLDYKSNQNTKGQVILSGFLFVDAISLCVFSLYLKKQEIKDFQNYAIFKFDNLADALRENSLLNQLQPIEIIKPFQSLRVSIKLIDPSQITIKCSRNKQVYSVKCSHVTQMQNFCRDYTKKYHLKKKVDFNILKQTDLQEYFEELMENYRHYEEQVLDFLNIEKDKQYALLEEVKNVRQTQLLQQQKGIADTNAIFFDLTINKFEKIDGHYYFFIVTRTLDKRIKKQIQRRYQQIFEFDKKLKSIQLNNGFRLKMPDFPEKHYFNRDDEEIIEQRKVKLQIYLRRVVNDKIFIKKHRQIKQAIYQFLELRLDMVSSVEQNTTVNYSNLIAEKGSYGNRMNNNKLSTYYTFIIKQNENRIKTICKRYHQFDEFNKQVRRWMDNTQVEYKFLHLPPKTINKNITEKDKEKRHTELANYLNMIFREVHNISDCYEFRRFLDLEQILDQIQAPPTKPLNESLDKSNASLIDGRMSNLINDLGEEISRL